mmetsp:Transcript_89605/g.208717  ORF Transcript_89605/g.208717 Transcript_89605/m.208717 type:complete len:199 (-) Transcript_89605:25-621(-)
MSLTQLLALGRVEEVRKPKAISSSTSPEVSMNEEQMQIARDFEEERQQEWAERRALAKAKARYEERKELEVASDLAHAVIFDAEVLEQVQRQALAKARGRGSSSSGSSTSRSRSSSSGSGNSSSRSLEETDNDQLRSCSRSRSRSRSSPHVELLVDPPQPGNSQLDKPLAAACLGSVKLPEERTADDACLQVASQREV